MKNTRIHLLFVLIAIFFSACEEKEGLPETSFGECSYYPSFLWSDADTCGVIKHLYLDFNDDAKAEEDTFVEMAFVDKESNPIPDDILEITIDGEVIKGNVFKVYSNETEKEIKFRFLPKAKSGNHQGYLKLLSYKLDRFEDQELTGNSVEVMRWSLYFDKRMNPLKKVFMWIGLLLLTSLFIWFIIIRPLLFPRIRLSRIELSSKKGYYTNKKINGTIKVVVTNKYKPQSWLSKMFCGKVLFIKDDIWTSSWEIAPKGRKKAAKISLHGNYVISPVTSELSNYGVYQLDNLTTKETITIKIL